LAVRPVYAGVILICKPVVVFSAGMKTTTKPDAKQHPEPDKPKKPERRGGWRGKAGSLASLDRHRPTCFAVLCARRGCRQPAVKKSPGGFCKMHGAGRYIRASPFRLALRAARAIVNRAWREGTFPPGLAVQPIWIASRRARVAVHRPRLMAAWLSLDPEEWPRTFALVEEAIAACPPLDSRPRVRVPPPDRKKK